MKLIFLEVIDLLIFSLLRLATESNLASSDIRIISAVLPALPGARSRLESGSVTSESLMLVQRSKIRYIILPDPITFLNVRYAAQNALLPVKMDGSKLASGRS